MPLQELPAERIFGEVQKLLLKARDLDPKLPEPYYGLGALYQLKGQKAEAIAAFEKFLAIGPGQDAQAAEFFEAACQVRIAPPGQRVGERGEILIGGEVSSQCRASGFDRGRLCAPSDAVTRTEAEVYDMALPDSLPNRSGQLAG